MESPDQIWELGDRRWTVEEEHRFGKRVDETVTEDFFIRYNDNSMTLENTVEIFNLALELKLNEQERSRGVYEIPLAMSKI